MTTDDREIVSALRAKLADRVGKDRFEVWFGPGTQLQVQGGTLMVGVPSRFFQDWLRSHFRKDLEASCLETFGEPMALEFRVNAPLAPVMAQMAQTPAAPKPRPVILREPPMRAPRRALAALETFSVGDSNCLAHKSAQLATDRPARLSPLFIHGPTGVGKTHLLEGILSSFKQQHRQAPAVYLSAEQFTSYFLEALHGSGLPNFRRKYRDVELLIVDDVQFFAGKKATLIELLHTIDTLLRSGRQLVFAADRAPRELKSLGPEMMARLSGGMVARIEPPEYATRLAVARQLARQLDVSAPDEVLCFMASHLTTHARELVGALKRLQATSLAHGRPITLALAEEALAELIHHSGRVVRLADIEKAVCDVFGLESDSLQSTGKGKTVSHPRMLAMWLARKHTRAALSEIGQFFGRRSHSTVISAQKKIESWMSGGSALKLNEQSWKLEDAIRRVEDNLRAG